MTDPDPVPASSDPETVPVSSTGDQPKRHWAAITALVLGILSLVAGLIPVLGFFAVIVLGPLAVVFGILGILGTRTGGLRGRTMSVVGICLAVVGAVAVVVWLFLVNQALDDSLDSIYGTRAEYNGPGRNEYEALPFGQTSGYPDGLAVTAAVPRAAAIPEEMLDAQNGWNIGVATTVTFTNNGSDPILFEPGARFNLGESACEPIGLTASVKPSPTQLQPGTTQTLEITAVCYTGDDDASRPTSEATPSPTASAPAEIKLQTWPEPYASQTWFTGALPPGAETQ